MDIRENVLLRYHWSKIKKTVNNYFGTEGRQFNEPKKVENRILTVCSVLHKLSAMTISSIVKSNISDIRCPQADRQFYWQSNYNNSRAKCVILAISK